LNIYIKIHLINLIFSLISETGVKQHLLLVKYQEQLQDVWIRVLDIYYIYLIIYYIRYLRLFFVSSLIDISEINAFNNSLLNHLLHISNISCLDNFLLINAYLWWHPQINTKKGWVIQRKTLPEFWKISPFSQAKKLDYNMRCLFIWD
jgi:hypothetical protein